MVQRRFDIFDEIVSPSLISCLLLPTFDLSSKVDRLPKDIFYSGNCMEAEKEGPGTPPR